ncbi:hypothetical protein [Treponema pedis]|uniref:hypothetical protein n=1 Tax=Treponema pedis TaxID=409322 RepID=UPI003D1B1EE6
MNEFFNNLGPTMYYIVIVPIFFIAIAIFSFIKMKNNKARTANWLSEHQNAVKVYINKNANIMDLSMPGLTVHTTDGELPITFTEGITSGFYLTPGTHIIESSFSKSRPGIMYRKVTTTYGPSKQEVSVEAFKTYNYRFDKKEETYIFEEIN